MILVRVEWSVNYDLVINRSVIIDIVFFYFFLLLKSDELTMQNRLVPDFSLCILTDEPNFYH